MIAINIYLIISSIIYLTAVYGRVTTSTIATIENEDPAAVKIHKFKKYFHENKLSLLLNFNRFL